MAIYLAKQKLFIRSFSYYCIVWSRCGTMALIPHKIDSTWHRVYSNFLILNQLRLTKKIVKISEILRVSGIFLEAILLVWNIFLKFCLLANFTVFNREQLIQGGPYCSYILWTARMTSMIYVQTNFWYVNKQYIGTFHPKLLI